MKRFWPYRSYFKPVRWHFAGGVVAGMVYAVASGLGLPLAAKVVFPLLFESENEDPPEVDKFQEILQGFLGELDRNDLVIAACLWLPVMFLLRSAGGFLNSYLIHYCGYRVVEGIRNSVFERMQALPVAFFHERQSGDLLARLIGDAELLRETIAKVSADIIKQPATLLWAAAFLIWQAFTNEGAFIVLIMCLTIPVCVVPIRLFAKKLGKRAEAMQRTVGDLSGQVAESLQAPMEIRAYNLQERMVEQFRAKIRRLIKYSMKVVKYRQMISPAVEFVAVIGLVAALYLGSQREMSLESFMAIAFALYMCYEPIKKLGNIHSLLRQGEAALDRMEEVLHAEVELEDPRNPRSPSPFRGDISFHEVSFGYQGEAVLKGISTVIRPGECVALIGPSGSGKSSFVNLIPRFYDVLEGSVSVSGIDVREWSKRELRERIAVVSQTPILFTGTIRDNILLGRPDASDEEVEAAARRANAHDFILRQPDGYDQAVAEKGTSLSGGQRQRIAIARAFLKDAEILILDEATSALDNESEAKVQDALAQLIKDRTTLLIAHRLSTTQIADRVLEFDDGRIVSDRSEA